MHVCHHRNCWSTSSNPRLLQWIWLPTPEQGWAMHSKWNHAVVVLNPEVAKPTKLWADVAHGLSGLSRWNSLTITSQNCLKRILSKTKDERGHSVDVRTMIHICAVLYIDWCPWLASHWLSWAAVVNADYYTSLWKLQCHSQFVTIQTSVATWLAWRPLPSVLWLAPYSKLQTGQWICSKEYTQMVCFLEGTIISVLLNCSPIPSINNITMSGQLETVNQHTYAMGFCAMSALPACSMVTRLLL